MISEVSIHDVDTICQHYLTILYQDIKNGRQGLNTSLTETTGEILYKSVNKLLSHANLRENDVFADLGSGFGKIVLQVFLKTLAKECFGIEIAPDLHSFAINAMNKLRHELPEFYGRDRQLYFLQGSFLDIPLSRATVVLINSVCFSPHLLESLGAIINETSNIHTIMTTRPMHNLWA